MLREPAVPIYEYRCQDCGKTFEYMQRMADEPKDTCEACGGPLERLISQSAFVLKGGGWYKDLYASPKPAEAKSEGSDSAGKSDGAADKESKKGTDSGQGKDKGADKSSSSSGAKGDGG